MGEVVVLERAEIGADERLKDLERRWSLQREQRVPRTCIHHHGVADAGDVLGDPGVVLLNIAGIDDQHEMRRRQPVHDNVVHECAVGCEQPGVLGLTDLQFRGVVARDALHRRERVLAGDFDLAHVADVEQTRARAHRHVLRRDARILNRHFPAAECDHLSRPMRDDGCAAMSS